MLYLFEMLNNKLYFAIIVLNCVCPNSANDIYSRFHQKDYKIEFQRWELIGYNKSFFNFLEIKTFKYNRTLTAINATFNSKVNMSTEIEVVVQFYKFLSNEYRELPGSRFQVNVCESLAANIVGLQSVFKCGNYTSCQVFQDTTYRACNAYPDESRFPPFAPNGEYKFQQELTHNNEIIATTAAYVKIYRPVPMPPKHRTVY